MGQPLLSRVQASNESWFRKLPSGARIRGVMHPVNPTQLPTSVFVLPRIALRCRLREPIEAGTLLRDRFQRVLLVGDHDLTLSALDPVSKVFALFQMTDELDWFRSVETQNPITKLTETLTSEPLGKIWVAIESFTRGDNDAGTRIPIDRLRMITNALLQTGDLVGTRTVKRTLVTLGVTVAEVE
jgi:hypothetical protein